MPQDPVSLPRYSLYQSEYLKKEMEDFWFLLEKYKKYYIPKFIYTEILILILDRKFFYYVIYNKKYFYQIIKYTLKYFNHEGIYTCNRYLENQTDHKREIYYWGTLKKLTKSVNWRSYGWNRIKKGLI